MTDSAVPRPTRPGRGTRITTRDLHLTKTEPCVRGHVPADANSLVGTAYSNLIQSQRLVNKDPFRMTVPDA